MQGNSSFFSSFFFFLFSFPPLLSLFTHHPMTGCCPLLATLAGIFSLNVMHKIPVRKEGRKELKKEEDGWKEKIDKAIVSGTQFSYFSSSLFQSLSPVLFPTFHNSISLLLLFILLLILLLPSHYWLPAHCLTVTACCTA